MAKRKTIGENPLDTLVPDRTTRRTDESAAAARVQSVDPATDSTRATTPRNQPKTKDSPLPTLATPVAQPLSPADLVNRIQSLEKENEYIKWLVGGAILLAIML